MGQPLINDKINDSLNLLVQKLFLGNRLLDRIMSVLSVKFVMKSTVDVLHPLLAHSYPLLADQISDYQDSKDCLTDYLDTPTDKSDYNTPKDAFVAYLDYSKELEEFIDECVQICKDNGDRTTKVFLEKFLLEIQKFTSQAQLLVDKAESYGNSPSQYMEFDRDIQKMIIVQPVQGKTFNG